MYAAPVLIIDPWTEMVCIYFLNMLSNTSRLSENTLCRSL